MMELNIVRKTETATLPVKAHRGDLGYDIFSDENSMVTPGETRLISTGISVMASNGKYGFIIKDRSSMAMKGLFSHAGVIDAGYTGEIKVLLHNSTDTTYQVRKFDKIAQMIPTPVIGFEVKDVEQHVNTTRGDGGFGSTGR